MQRTQLIIIGLWIALMFTYLLGDILRLYSGDVKVGELLGEKTSQTMYIAIAAFMFIPIFMIIVNLMFEGDDLRWLNIIVTSFLALVNIVGLPSYKSWYDIILIACSIIINLLILWHAY